MSRQGLILVLMGALTVHCAYDGGDTRGAGGGSAGTGGRAGTGGQGLDGGAGAGGAAGAAGLGGDAGEAGDGGEDYEPIGKPERCPGAELRFRSGTEHVARARGSLMPGKDAKGSCGGIGKDVVYRFTPPITGKTTVRLTSEGFDGVLHLRSACGDAEAELGCRDVVVGAGTETMELFGEAGTEYFVWGDSKDAKSAGDYELTVTVSGGTPLEVCPGETVSWSGSGTDPRRATLTGDTAALWGDEEGSCASVGKDAVYALTAPVSGVLDLELQTTGREGTLYLRQACVDPSTELMCRVGSRLQEQRLVEAGETLYAFVDGPTAGADGSYRLDASLRPWEPHERCPGQAVALTGAGTAPRYATVTGNTSRLWAEQMASCASAAKDAVYSITPDADGLLQLELFPSAWDASLIVRSSCDAQPSSQLACINDGGSSATERYTGKVRAGVPLTVVVDGATAADVGAYTLKATLAPETGDEACPGQALTLSGGNGVYAGSVSGDTRLRWPDHAGPTTCAPGMAAARDAVFAITPPVNGSLQVRLQAQGWDSVLYASTSCGTPWQQCDHQPVGGTESVSFNADANATYYVVVDGATAADAGLYTLQAQLTQINDAERCPGELVQLSGSSGGLNADITGFTPDYRGCSTLGAHDAVYRVVAPTTGRMQVVLDSPTFDGYLYVRTSCTDAGSELSCGTGNGVGASEFVSFDTVSGQTYYVIVGAASGGLTAPADFTLRFTVL